MGDTGAPLSSLVDPKRAQELTAQMGPQNGAPQIVEALPVGPTAASDPTRGIEPAEGPPVGDPTGDPMRSTAPVRATDQPTVAAAADTDQPAVAAATGEADTNSPDAEAPPLTASLCAGGAARGDSAKEGGVTADPTAAADQANSLPTGRIFTRRI